MTAVESTKARHLVIRLARGDALPDALTAALREHGVACGWVRASGVLEDVELRAYEAATGGLGPVRHLAGPLQAVSIEGSIGLTEGDVTVGLRGVLAREGERGLDTIAGEIAQARVVALEAFVTALDDVAMERALDDDAGVWLLGDAGAVTARPSPREAAWGEAITASAEAERPAAPRRAPITSTTGGAAMPQRPARPSAPEEAEQMVPDAGDRVDHFAFGPCEVLKSENDRLHVKLDRDGRIKEIALEMLRVIPLPSDGPHRRFKLERRL